MTLQPAPSMSTEELLEPGGPVLLIEFVNADQFPGRISVLFPLVGGYFRTRGLPVRWVRFGVSTLNLMENDRDEITLTEEEHEHLLGVVSEHAPVVVLMTDALHAPQAEALRARVPDCRFLVTTGDPRTDLLYEARWPMQATPDLRPFYGWEPGNAAAEQRRIDNIYLLSTDGCGHHLAVAANPRFRNLELGLIEENLGCTFCTSSRTPLKGSNESRFRVRNLSSWTARQVEALAEDRRAVGRMPNALLFERLPGEAVQAQCLRSLRETGLDEAVQIAFAIRTNRIPAFEERMEAHFGEHPDSSLVFGVYASGIESFSARELTLFNKGTTPLDGVRAFNTLRALSHRYPDHFWFTGLSFLLFTPWTTLDSLHLNVGLLQLLCIGRKEAGNIFQSRLRLHEKLPLRVLAKEEGLLIDEIEDPVLVMNRRKLFTEEHPWKFGDPRLEPLTQVSLRFDLLHSDPTDPILTHLEATLEAVSEGGKIDDDELLVAFLLALTEATLAQEEVLTIEVLLESAAAILPRRRAALDRVRGPVRFRIGAERLALPALVERLRAVAGSPGGPRVISLGGLRPEDGAATLVQSLQTAGWGARLDQDELLFARDARDLDRFDSLRGGPEEETSLRERATLLGQPPCCAAASASRPDRDGRVPIPRSLGGRLGGSWGALALRQGVPGSLPPSLAAPWLPALAFPTCEPGCPAAAKVMAGWLETIGAGPGDDEKLLALVSLQTESDGELTTLRVSEVQGATLFYDPRSVRGSDPELVETLQRADHLVQVPGQIQIHAGPRLLRCLTGTHGLFFAGGAADAEVWSELARGVALLEAIGHDREKTYRPLMLTWQPESESESPEVQAAMDSETSESATFDGDSEEESGPATFERGLALLRAARAGIDAPVSDLEVLDLWEADEGGLIVRVSLEGCFYSVRLMDPASPEDHLLRTEHFNVAQARSKDDPLRSQEHRATLEVLIRAFDRHLGTEAPDLLPTAR